MELTVVPIAKPDATNFILGQSHFIKTVEDLHEALVGAVPGIRFGLAFCEASGKRLVRWSGNDEAALALARDNALAIGAGHSFLIFLGDGFFPVNVLAAVRAVPEVCRIYCATADQAEFFASAVKEAGERYDRYSQRRDDWWKFSRRRERLRKIKQLTESLSAALCMLDILNRDELDSRIGPRKDRVSDRPPQSAAP